MYIEEDYEYSLDPEVFGKGDIRIVVPSHGIIIIDHKNGSGVMVEPDDSQLKMYGYMGFESTKEYLGEIPVIEMWISQPRKPHKDGPHRSVYMTGEELTNWWLDTLLPALAAAREENALLKTGEWCRFCPAKMDCPATKGEVDDVKIVGNVDTLSNEEIGRLMAKRAVIVKFLEAINAEGNARAKKGEMIPGFKLVHQKGNRAWKDSMNEKDENGVEKKVTFAEAVVARFGKEAYEPQVLKSPPQIEKLVEGSRFVSKWAYTPQTGLTLAPDSDKRAAVKPAIEQFMDDMAAQETKGDDSK
ncbi:MAG TPA: hypothetical protein DDZ51_22155 [Planctomycetaceae bacterium]|nr:hypothetical protein [Planctomycetaceae bacterium]